VLDALGVNLASRGYASRAGAAAILAARKAAASNSDVMPLLR
jgi:hypothetical protein